MIWSVSMLAPNFQARPRMTFGSVTKSTPRRPPSRDPRRHLLQDLARVRDDTGHRTGGGHRGVGKVDHRLRVAHAPWEVSIRSRKANLAFAEDAHVPAEASTACGRRPSGSRRQEGPDQTFALGLDRNLVRRGRDDEPDAVGDLVAF